MGAGANLLLNLFSVTRSLASTGDVVYLQESQDDSTCLQTAAATMNTETTLRSDDVTKSSTDLCYAGRQLPGLFVLGAQKAASSSISKHLVLAGLTPALQARPVGKLKQKECWWPPGKLPPSGGNCYFKEFHFFDEWNEWWEALSFSEVSAAGERQWLAALPACNSSLLYADFTPDYLGLVPKPSGRFYGSDYGHMIDISKGDLPAGRPNLPLVIRSLYRGVQRLPIFMVSLRDFLPRMHAAWYHAQRANFTGVCIECRASSFGDALTNAVLAARRGHHQDWLWLSMVGTLLKQWQALPAHHFIFVSFAQFTQHGAQSMCHHLQERLSRRLDCAHGVFHENAGEHPALSEEVVETGTMAAFDALMQSEKQLLKKVLSQMQSAGAVLVGYGGRNASLDDIEQWLQFKNQSRN